MSFVPIDFDPPRSLVLDPFRLEVLSPQYAPIDYEAVRSSGEEIALAYGPESWWSVDLTYEQNYADLVRHEQEFAAREAFAYALLSAASGAYLGCIYLYETEPAIRHLFQARVYYWLVHGQQTITDTEAFPIFSKWLATAWPFKTVVFPGRSLSWAEWAALRQRLHTP